MMQSDKGTTLGHIQTRARLGWLVAGLLACAGCATDPAPEPQGCDPSAAEGIAVTDRDVYGGAPYRLGYSPYAIDGCQLAYVAQPAGAAATGELRLRDLVTGEETVLAPASEAPRRPVVVGSLVSWEATEMGKSVVRVRDAGETTTLAGPFDHAGEPRAAADAVVFTAWLAADEAGDTDVFLYELSTGALAALGTGPGQQRFPDVSATHVAWTDFAEDPDGTFDEDELDVADIVVHDRRTGATSPRARAGKQAFPLLGAYDKLAFLDWNLVHPEPKLTAYELWIADIDPAASEPVLVEPIVTRAPYVRPVARGGLLEWVSSDIDSASLWRRPVDLSSPAEMLLDAGNLDLFGPTAAEGITLLGARAPGAPVTLRAVAR